MQTPVKGRQKTAVILIALMTFGSFMFIGTNYFNRIDGSSYRQLAPTSFVTLRKLQQHEPLISSKNNDTVKLLRNLTLAAEPWFEEVIMEGLEFCFTADRPNIYVITPTYTRDTQLADLTKMAQTLMLVPDVVWILLEDHPMKSERVSALLKRSKIRHYHRAVETPNKSNPETNVFARGGLTQRNFGLYVLRKYFAHLHPSNVKGWVYFGDDDNVYDVRLFEKMKRIERLGVWPVGFAGGIMVEGLEYKNGSDTELSKGKVPHVTKWVVEYLPERSFAVDMAGFAVALSEILNQTTAVMTPFELPEFRFLDDMKFTKTDAEAVAYDTNDVLVWHTKFQTPDRDWENDFKKRYGVFSYERYNV